jgi:peptidoglycan/xylan/chitin deacetylase (PgdA/CDA1 family)
MKRSLKTHLKQVLVSTVHRSRAAHVMPAGVRGIGLLLMLHRVRSSRVEGFAPNASLEITPDFLDRLISRLKACQIDLVDLDEAARRLDRAGHGAGGADGRRFACFTLDDGYLDNYKHARPIFERHQVPYAVYLATGIADRTAVWLEGKVEHFRTVTGAEKAYAFNTIKNCLRHLEAPAAVEHAARLAADVDIDPAAVCAAEGMTWDMIRAIANSPFGHVEAHTSQHLSVSRQTPDAAAEDILAGVERTVAETGCRPRHFAYPYGDALAAGPRDFELLKTLPFVTAVTTREGVLHPRHAAAKTALPRICVNGYYQSDSFIDLMIGGVSSLFTGRDALQRMFARVGAA